MAGNAANALAALSKAHANGAEPEMAIADLMDLVHQASFTLAAGVAATICWK